MTRALSHPIKIRALSEMKTCFFSINREVATTILLSHTVKQVLHFRHLHASYLTRF